MTNETYIIKTFAPGECKICGKQAELRMGACWDCVEAESIIDEGVDMDDKNFLGQNHPETLAINKLRLLIKKGWHK